MMSERKVIDCDFCGRRDILEYNEVPAQKKRRFPYRKFKKNTKLHKCITCRTAEQIKRYG